jgi:hypothetical protein
MEGKPEASSSSTHKVVGFVLAGALVVAAALLFRAYAPKLRGPTPGEALRAALEAQLPASQSQVTFSEDVLRIALIVPFDPTVDAEPAHETFQAALAIANAQALEGFTGVEISLAGTSIEGRGTSASRTFDYTPQPLD